MITIVATAAAVIIIITIIINLETIISENFLCAVDSAILSFKLSDP